MAYGARLESVLGESPRGFESPILRRYDRRPRPKGAAFCRIHAVPPTQNAGLGRAPALGTLPDRGLDMHQRLVDGETITLRLRPGRDAKSFILAASLAFASPVLTLLWLAWGLPGMGVVLVWVAAAALSLAVVTFGLSRTKFEFRPDRLVEYPFLSRPRATPVTELESVRVVSAYTGRSLDTHVQVFFLDADGRSRARIKGIHWGDRLALRASTAYGLPVEKLSEPLTKTELRRRFRSDVNVLERHPVIWAAAQSVLVLGVGLPLLESLTTAVHH